MLKNITDVFSSKGVNIANMLNKSKGDNAYTMIDIDDKCDSALIKEIEGMNDVIKVTLL